jgi:hypothetical protein
MSSNAVQPDWSPELAWASQPALLPAGTNAQHLVRAPHSPVGPVAPPLLEPLLEPELLPLPASGSASAPPSPACAAHCTAQLSF